LEVLRILGVLEALKAFGFLEAQEALTVAAKAPRYNPLKR
jgi:hypothetical protein